MKKRLMLMMGLITLIVWGCNQGTKEVAQTMPVTEEGLYLDVHDIGPGKVTFEAVAEAHEKDLATQGEFNVNFIKYWVDEQAGKVYCLARASSAADVYKTHNKAHGLVPDNIMQVVEGQEASLKGKQLFLDIHHLEPGAVSANDVVKAHEKDLAVQSKYDVNFINYWLDSERGTVFCLSEAPDSLAVINTHKEAHGLIPAKVERVKQGM
jgi:hypothetical protein